jgi:uncharacterized membrane protein
LKLRVPSDLLLIDAFCILLIIVIISDSSNIARIILGLPALLFFPGYAFMEALFVNRQRLTSVERISLSFGLSIALVPLMGLLLNYTPWGIAFVPVLFSEAMFIFIMSDIALIRRAIHRQATMTMEINLKIRGLKGGALNKSLYAITGLAVIGTIGVLIFTLAAPKVGEKFTEFYVLGNGGKADGYPSDFAVTSGVVAAVSYDGGQTFITGSIGQVTLGIINHEGIETRYTITVRINAQPVDINSGGKNVSQIDQIDLLPGEKWQQEVGFAPQQPGDKQKVEFLLFKESSGKPEDSLHLWVNAQSR